MTNKVTNRVRPNCIGSGDVRKARILAILVDKRSLYQNTSKVDHKIVKEYADYITVWPAIVSYNIEGLPEVSIYLNRSRVDLDIAS